MASLVTGFILQSAMVIVDLAMTPPMALPFLESIHPGLMGHGVILCMLLSGLVFFGVSLATAPTSQMRLALFFRSEAERLTSVTDKQVMGTLHPEILDAIEEQSCGKRTILHLSCDILGTIEWKTFVKSLQNSGEKWVSAAGLESVRRITNPDILSCVSVTRGKENATLWLEAESNAESLVMVKNEICHAYDEILNVVKG